MAKYQSNIIVSVPIFFFLYSLFPGLIAQGCLFIWGYPEVTFFLNALVAPRQTSSLEGQGLFCQGDHTLDEEAQF